MLYAKLIGRIALFTCENIAHIEFYLQGLLPKILAIYTIKLSYMIAFLIYSRGSSDIYLNNTVFLSRNYRLIVARRKFDVLKTKICPRSEASRANMLVLRTSNFQGATIRPIDPNTLFSLLFTTKFSSARWLKNHVELFSTF